MKKKSIIIGVIGIILIMGLYFGYKGTCLYLYSTKITNNDNYNKFVNGYKVSDTIKINSIKSNDYITFNNIKIKNIFKDFEKINDNNKNIERYKLTYEKGKSATFFIGETITYLDMLKSQFKEYKKDIRFKNLNIDNILKENNISNDIELFNYFRENKKFNIFSSVKEMKSYFVLHDILTIVLPSINSITVVNGDYTGYIFNMNSTKETCILKNGKRYVFTFVNTEYFTNNIIKELLNSIDIIDE